MKKLPKTAVISIIVCLLIFCFGLGWALHVRSGYGAVFDPSNENVSDFILSFKRSDAPVNRMSMPGSAKELIRESDTVIIAEVGSDRSFIGNHLLTPVRVVKVLSGEDPGAEEIFVYEPVQYFVSYESAGARGSVKLEGATMPLHYGEKYLLALDHIEYPEGYNMNEREKHTYLFSFNGCSAFPYDNEPKHVSVIPEEMVTSPKAGELAGVYYYSDQKAVEQCLLLYEQMTEAFPPEG